MLPCLRRQPAHAIETKLFVVGSQRRTDQTSHAIRGRQLGVQRVATGVNNLPTVWHIERLPGEISETGVSSPGNSRLNVPFSCRPDSTPLALPVAVPCGQCHRLISPIRDDETARGIGNISTGWQSPTGYGCPCFGQSASFPLAVESSALSAST